MLRSALLAAAACSLPAAATHYAAAFKPLAEPYQTMALVLEDLFPAAPGIPTLADLNTLGYIRGVMDDTWVAQNDKRFLRNGVTWLHEESTSMFGKKYTGLDAQQRQRVLQAVSAVRWGDNWLYAMFNYLFESMFCDPLYGANTDASGWRWLSHVPGYPRPKEVTL